MNNTQNTYAHLQTLADGRARRIDGVKGQPATWHLWKNAEINAITLALAAGRPLLVRGEPGTGNSQLARAAASALGWALHTATLHVRSEPQDLLYQFDAVRRLADAQANNLKDENRYWQPQALWKALDWDSAHDYGALLLARENGNKPPAPPGHVVLIDEIDKAPSDVPNGLLEVLGARCFEIPGIPLLVSPQAAVGDGAQAGNWPLVIITTNEERDLPDAFLRRCMVLTHDVEADGNYGGFLLRHGRAHFGPNRDGLDHHRDATIDETLLQRAADKLVEDRKAAQRAQLAVPGLAEYLDLLYALHDLAPGESAKQGQWLDKLYQYAYRKNRIDGDAPSPLRQQHAADVDVSGQPGQPGQPET